MEIHDLMKEGSSRNNLANTLIKLERYDDARQEILQAIECDKPFGHTAEPWNTYDILYDLERAVGNEKKAIEAREKAFQLFLSYRRADGENYTSHGDLCAQVKQLLNSMPPQEIGRRLANLTLPESAQLFRSKLLLILGGSRDRYLIEDPNLFYMDAVELVLLLERIGAGA